MAKKYSTYVNELKLKIGDTVVVKRKTTNGANGWESNWVSGMDRYIGLTGRIQTDPSDPNGVMIEGMERYYFPIFVLENSLLINELTITREEVVFWSNHNGVCNTWKEAIKEEFDLYSNQETFLADASFIEEAYSEAEPEIIKRLIKRFPITLAKYAAYQNIADKDDINDLKANLTEILDSYVDEKFLTKIPGKNNMDKAETILDLLIATYNK